MIHFAGIIRRHLNNVLNYIAYPLTNAVTEGLNAKIHGSSIRRVAFGIASGSSWRSTSTAAASISLRDYENALIFEPTTKPEDPSVLIMCVPWLAYDYLKGVQSDSCGN